MAKEIERKFLIDRNHPDVQTILSTKPTKIRQGYIMSADTGVVRIRITDDVAFLTVKTRNSGISRDEYEYEIPKNDAETMLSAMCGKVVEKERYLHQLPDGNTLELDDFAQIDLLMGEVELASEDAPLDTPEWFLREVSQDPAYFNNEIAKRI
jgi:adenylate cyclase